MNVWWRYSFAGLLLLVPAWITFLVLSALISTVNRLIGELMRNFGFSETPLLGLLLFCLLVIFTGALATRMMGRQLLTEAERWIESLPLVRSIYLTLKGMTDLFQFRSRFGRSTVVAFPFPRDGLWALGFVMGVAPAAVQVDPALTLTMVFVPTAIHPFTGFLAFIPEYKLRHLNLLPEEAMKMEFSAGFYTPAAGWSNIPRSAT